MSLFKRGNVYWFKFKHEGQVIRESAETEDRAQAAKAERKRHSALDNGAKAKRRPRAAQQFTVAVAHWLALKKGDWSANNLRIETANFGHLENSFKGKKLRHITAEEISEHKAKRREDGASDKTIALEIGSYGH